MTEAELVEPEIMEVATMPTDGALSIQEKATLDVQIATAKEYPRSIKKFMSDLETWATSTEDIADSCTFELPRGGRRVIGPSIRFAELVGAAYGNLRIDSKPIEEEMRYVKVEGTCMDLERNVGFRAIAQRRITKRNGERYDDDGIQNAINAAASIAVRNAIFRVVPRAMWLPIWEKAKQVSGGEGTSFEWRLSNVKTWLQEKEVPEENALALVGRDGWADVVADDLLVIGLRAKSVGKGTQTLSDAFPTPKLTSDPEAASTRAAAAEARLDKAIEAVVQKEEK